MLSRKEKFLAIEEIKQYIRDHPAMIKKLSNEIDLEGTVPSVTPRGRYAIRSCLRGVGKTKNECDYEMVIYTKLSKIFLNRDSEVIRLYRDKRTGKQFTIEWITPDDPDYELIGEISAEEYLRLIQEREMKYHGAHKPIYDAFEKYFGNVKVLLEETDECDICNTLREQGARPVCYRDCPDFEYLYFLIGDVMHYLQRIDTALAEKTCDPSYTREQLIKSNDWSWEDCFIIKMRVADFLLGHFSQCERILLFLVEKSSPVYGDNNIVRWITYKDVPEDYDNWSIPAEVARKFTNERFFGNFKSRL